MATYRTIAAPISIETEKVKGSRFLTFVEPARSEAEAVAAVQALREAMPDATHHCYAWRLGPGTDRFRYSDDGEPRGTAGQPIFKHIEGRDLKDLVVVVVRYFGGTKLGSGGLLRAYSEAARQGLEQVQVVEVEVTTAVEVTYDYTISGQVRAVLAAHGLSPASERFGAQVEMTVHVKDEGVQAFVTDMVERTAGLATVQVQPRGDTR